MTPHEAVSGQPFELFMSYVPRMTRSAGVLRHIFSPLVREGTILPWHHRNITAGTEWKDQIDQHIESSDIILLLISADFVASDYCFSNDMLQALKRHDAGEARVIPIILRPCDWQSTDSPS